MELKEYVLVTLVAKVGKKYRVVCRFMTISKWAKVKQEYQFITYLTRTQAKKLYKDIDGVFGDGF